MEQDEEETKKKKKQKKWDRDRDFGFSRRVPRSCATGSASFYRVSAVHLAFFFLLVFVFSSSFFRVFWRSYSFWRSESRLFSPAAPSER